LKKLKKPSILHHHIHQICVDHMDLKINWKIKTTFENFFIHTHHLHLGSKSSQYH